ncbi:MAG: VWA domain-containing protein [Bacteroidia bacterium]|nr:VWA domain-containing protein [Bacteroidia bacterium]
MISVIAIDMRLFLINILLFFGIVLRGQNSVIHADQTFHDYGAVENVYKLQSDFILQNKGTKNLYLMRADVGKNVKIWTSKKTIVPGDTVAVQVNYFPTDPGKFNETINLVTSADAEAFILKIKGEVKSIKKDDKTACYSFKHKGPNTGGGTGLITMTNPGPKKPDSLLKYASNNHGFMTPGTGHFATQQINLEPKFAPIPTLLDRDTYKPNNVVFLIDVSGSMADSMKLSLMKISLQKLLDNLREEDRVSVVTYRDTFICVADSLNGRDKEKLKTLVGGLKAKGLTSGNKAIHYSLTLALKNYIAEGNNQIILATDGRFFFRDKDYQKWTALVGNKKVILSTIALGADDFAMKNLQAISKKGQGSFIHIDSKQKAESAVFDEIEMRSRK